MKKLYPAILVSAIAIIMSASCNKNYTCTCLVTSKGVTHVVSTDIGKASKSDAQGQCDKVHDQYIDTVSGVTVSCHL